MRKYNTQRYANTLLLAIQIFLAANLTIGNSNILQSIPTQKTVIAFEPI